MRRLLQILKAYLANSIALDLEYRWDAVFNLVSILLSLMVGSLTLYVLFLHAQGLGGWTFYEALALYGVFFLFEEWVMEVLPANIGRLPEDVRTGAFDFVLLKPVGSQLQCSVRRFPIASLPTFVLAFGIIGTSMAALGTLTPVNVALLVMLIGCGLVITTALVTLLMTTAFWFVRVENLTVLFSFVFAAARFPVSAYPPFLRTVFTVLLPIAFITTVPASAAIGRPDPELLLLAPVVALVLLAASRAFWHFAIRHYTSASS